MFPQYATTIKNLRGVVFADFKTENVDKTLNWLVKKFRYRNLGVSPSTLQEAEEFFEDKLKFTPLAGGFIVSDWDDIKNNYAIIYAPELSYMATDNLELNLSVALFDGKGDNIFANFTDYNMLMFKVKYSF